MGNSERTSIDFLKIWSIRHIMDDFQLDGQIECKRTSARQKITVICTGVSKMFMFFVCIMKLLRYNYILLIYS